MQRGIDHVHLMAVDISLAEVEPGAQSPVRLPVFGGRQVGLRQRTAVEHPPRGRAGQQLHEVDVVRWMSGAAEHAPVTTGRAGGGPTTSYRVVISTLIHRGPPTPDERQTPGVLDRPRAP